MQKKRLTKKTFEALLNTVAYPEKWHKEDIVPYYNSKIDDSYICHGTATLKELFKRGITEMIQAGNRQKKVSVIGFSPDRKMWFGWSHRAICGFRVGTVLKKNHVIFGSGGWTEVCKEDKAYRRKLKRFKPPFKIKTLKECKDLACLFAESVG